MNQGTPKTLTEAIRNGIVDSLQRHERQSVTIDRHVRDYLNQKFGVVMLQHPEATPLLEKLRAMIHGENQQ